MSSHDSQRMLGLAARAAFSVITSKSTQESSAYGVRFMGFVRGKMKVAEKMNGISVGVRQLKGGT